MSPATAPAARGAHSLGELPQLGLDAAVAHAHARERRADVPCGPWRGKSVAWERAHRDRCTPGLGHEGARWPAKARPCPAHPVPRIPQSCWSCPQDPTILPVLSRSPWRMDHSPVVTEPTTALPTRPCQPFCSCRSPSLSWERSEPKSPRSQPKSPPPTRSHLQGCPDAGARVPPPAHWFSPPEGTEDPGPCSSDQKAKETPEPTGKAHLPLCPLRADEGVISRRIQTR